MNEPEDRVRPTGSAGRLCTVWASERVDGMYLFTDRKAGLADVPGPLLERFGRPREAMVLHVRVDRRLAHASAPEVLDAIERNGFYLQMPPPTVGRTPTAGNDAVSAPEAGR